MRDLLAVYLLLSLSTSAGVVVVSLLRSRRIGPRLDGGAVPFRPRVVDSEFGVFVWASCPEEAAAIVSLSDAFKPVRSRK